MTFQTTYVRQILPPSLSSSFSFSSSSSLSSSLSLSLLWPGLPGLPGLPTLVSSFSSSSSSSSSLSPLGLVGRFVGFPAVYDKSKIDYYSWTIIFGRVQSKIEMKLLLQMKYFRMRTMNILNEFFLVSCPSLCKSVVEKFWVTMIIWLIEFINKHYNFPKISDWTNTINWLKKSIIVP